MVILSEAKDLDRGKMLGVAQHDSSAHNDAMPCLGAPPGIECYFDPMRFRETKFRIRSIACSSSS